MYFTYPLQRSCPIGLGFFNTITMSLFDLIVIGMTGHI